MPISLTLSLALSLSLLGGLTVLEWKGRVPFTFMSVSLALRRANHASGRDACLSSLSFFRIPVWTPPNVSNLPDAGHYRPRRRAGAGESPARRACCPGSQVSAETGELPQNFHLRKIHPQTRRCHARRAYCLSTRHARKQSPPSRILSGAADGR
ncbi:hypothetical protein EVAR_25947_1 [Eumeta japonica]|uniref:Secreted protein n=1 Tax=Eumeta variegata TaxID=151549 RepID=A0A4C1V1B8_EUMVA|nr:hypothetical protein EVAR_25947_1 [Eumeta japonica]